ncbi:MAG: aldo/keto reductase, partial [Ferruginibacter sp.]
TAFERGITHFDLANNYGPAPGTAEINFGKILKQNFTGYLRDELIIATKAGWEMWPGPYGNFGSRKYLLASLDQSLQRMQIPYVDIFYSHRPDPDTPMEETMMALDTAVKSGKALYAGISSYSAAQTKKAAAILKELGTPCLIHQPKYSMLERWVETKTPDESLLDVLPQTGMGCIAFSPLAQGMLSAKYLKGIPKHSRAIKENTSLKPAYLTSEKLEVVAALNALAASRKQTLAQMAIAWLLKDERITSVLIGASTVDQLNENLDTLDNLKFTSEELEKIEKIVNIVS